MEPTIIQFYILHLSTDSGGTSKYEQHLCNTLTEVHRILMLDLVREAETAICYGEHMYLYTCQYEKSVHLPQIITDARVINKVDLHQFITFYVGNFAPIKFDDDNKIIGYANNWLRDYDSDSSDDDNFDKSIDFSSRKLREVYRYLTNDTKKIFETLRKKGKQSGCISKIPPNVGVQIDFTTFPRAENEDRRFRGTIQVRIGKKLHTFTK